MFFRTKVFHRKDGSTRTYLELVAGLARHSHEQWLHMEALHAERDYAYGPVLVFRRLWEHLGLAQALREAFEGTDA